MVDIINNSLSYDFLPNIIEILKIIGISMGISVILVIIFGIFAYITNNIENNIFTKLGTLVLIAFVIQASIAIAILILIPTLFCIISLKFGIMEVFNMSEIFAGIISSIFYIIIVSLITNSLVFKN